MSYRLLKTFFLFSFMFVSVSQVTDAAKIPDDIRFAKHFGTNMEQVLPETDRNPHQTANPTRKGFIAWLESPSIKLWHRTLKLNSWWTMGGACVLYTGFLCWDAHYSHLNSRESRISYMARNPSGYIGFMEEQRLRNEVKDLRQEVKNLNCPGNNDPYRTFKSPSSLDITGEELRKEVKDLRREVTNHNCPGSYKDNDSPFTITPPLFLDIVGQQRLRNEVKDLRQEVTKLKRY